MNGFLLYSGRYRAIVRLAAIVFVTFSISGGRHGPGLHGGALVVLVSLVVTDAAQVALMVQRSEKSAVVLCVLGAVASAALVGYDPSSSAVVLLAFAGLDVGANLPFAEGLALTLSAAILEILALLAAGHLLAYAALGLATLAGFLSATTLRQYTLRAEDAELRLATAEHLRAEEARAAALAERANAAREIHDILAHSLGALVLQLDALEAVLSVDEIDRARSATILGRARALATDGLTEARRAVSSLRPDAPPLVESVRRLVEVSGLGTLTITGTPRPVDGEVTVTVHRTAQEALTNAAKHAPGAPPVIELRFEPDAVTLTVTDEGRPDGTPPAPLAGTGGGYGLDGLRERANLIDGVLRAGPHGDGWQVELRVPTRVRPGPAGATDRPAPPARRDAATAPGRPA